MLTTAIAAALVSVPGVLLAQPTVSANEALAGINVSEAPRVTQAVSNSHLSSLPKSHLAFVAQSTSNTPLAGATPMSHLQLVLKPSALRTAELTTLIANQHNPKSAQFHQWLTPQQFGEAFGVVDSDIAAATSWLVSQGFTVNGVYPNKSQVDFSGTAAQVNLAFHTQENVYTLSDGSQHFANASDISVPTALQPVITGVMGLNSMQLKPSRKMPAAAKWNPSTGRFNALASKTASSHSMTIGQGGLNGVRGLVPNDLAKMYGVSTIRNNGVTGKGITIALIELGSALPNDWSNFVTQFNLTPFGGTFEQVNPQLGSLNNCYNVDTINHAQFESIETVEDMEAATAIAPGANIEVADCSAVTNTYAPASTNIYQGYFIAGTNLVNGDARPDIMSFTISYSELQTDSASEAGIDLMAAQADAEGISIFAGTGTTGSNPSFNSRVITGVGISAGSIVSSPNVTAVGGTDLADELDGTTSQYFSATPNAVYGTALGYVPEIPWNSSCGNGVVAKANGFPDVVSLCQFMLSQDPDAKYVTSLGSSSGASTVISKPAWQRMVYNTAKDQSRDVPDVSLFGGSYGGDTGLVLCMQDYPCTPNFSEPVVVVANESMAAPMFAGIQALIDQGLVMRGLPADQGNAAPTLYALAQQEYGAASGPAPASLSACNADNGDTGTANCVFHNITRGSTSTQCDHYVGEISYVTGQPINTPNCYYYGTADIEGLVYSFGLSTTDASPTTYGPGNKAYGAQPGWSFASGLGSVNATNLLIAWRAFVNAPAAAAP